MLSTEDLRSQLYTFMSEQYSGQLNFLPEYRACQHRRERLFARLQAEMGADFAGKLRDALTEGEVMELEAAFSWGVRLGLALERL